MLFRLEGTAEYLQATTSQLIYADATPSEHCRGLSWRICAGFGDLDH